MRYFLNMFYQRARNKYGNKKQDYNGRLYMSKGEAGYARELELRKKAGEITEIVPQFRLSLDVNGYHICNYIVDFKVTLKDGSEEIHEYKGFSTPLFLYKWKLTEALYGNKYKMVLIK